MRLPSSKSPYDKNGFTLIELSIVLVIIGLIAGGVLVGRDLINAAAIRAQISQIEKIQTAVNTFRGKFNALPGDMGTAIANQFGFPGTRTSDPPVVTLDNGLIEGERSGDGIPNAQGSYETGNFVMDLSGNAGGHLIDGDFSAIADGLGTCATYGPASSARCLPTAKIGTNNYLYPYNDGTANWLGLAGIPTTSFDNLPNFSVAITVAQASAIDTKMDDGMPITGTVNTAIVLSSGVLLSGTTGAALNPTTNPCYNNGNSAGAPVIYYMAVNNGANKVCELSFKFR